MVDFEPAKIMTLLYFGCVIVINANIITGISAV
jgi:hypothetical protein